MNQYNRVLHTIVDLYNVKYIDDVICRKNVEVYIGPTLNNREIGKEEELINTLIRL